LRRISLRKKIPVQREISKEAFLTASEDSSMDD
jgi:hypothetical protein